MSNIYGVSDDIQTISTQTFLYVSLSLKSGHFLMWSPINKSVYFTELDAILKLCIIAHTVINSPKANLTYRHYIQVFVLYCSYVVNVCVYDDALHFQTSLTLLLLL